MAHLLDTTRSYRSRARQLVLASLRSFAEQCRRGFAEARAVTFPASFRKIDQVVVVGMGGSALGSDVIRSVFFDQLRVPLTVVNGYNLPNSVTSRTLVLLSSYSGTTEEVLFAAQEAVRRRAKITGLTQGGSLARFFERHALPWYRIDGSANPADQPRMGLGYSIMGQLGLLSSLKLLPVTLPNIQEAIGVVERRTRQSDPDIPVARNQAKRLANALVGRFPILMGAGPLIGSLHAFANQLNETAKIFAVPFSLPELNHHLLEGLRYPRAIKQGTLVAFHSDLYRPRIVQREKATLDIVRRLGLRTERVAVNGSSRLAQALDLLGLSGATSFYLSVLNRVDPLKIPTVDELKRRLRRAA
jgi:glucose/mannose-6-phosphate isomerase